ncbi:hypothetical protein D6Z49_15285 [Escherichia coli]|nr:hypothetical protein [Escherichia coli]
MARNPKGFGGDRQVRSNCPGGVGLDDWTASAGQEPKGAIIPYQQKQTGNLMGRKMQRNVKTEEKRDTCPQLH